MKPVADSQAALTSMQSEVGHWADSLTRLAKDITWLGAVGSVPMPYPIPAIHIRREPLLPPAEPGPIAPSTQRLRASRIGRPRGSCDWYPERVVQTDGQLRCPDRHITQERLALELGVTLRTLQRWLTPEHMDLGSPPAL